MRQTADPGGEPRVLGWDAAGVVVAVGTDGELFSVGDEVYYAGALDRPGANSRYHAVDERLVARKPRNLSFTEAAALPLTTLTAWEGLFERLGLRIGALEQTGALLLTAARRRRLHDRTAGARPDQPDRDRNGIPPRDLGVRPADGLPAHRRPSQAACPATRQGGTRRCRLHLLHRRHRPQSGRLRRRINPFGHIVATDDFDSLPIGALKPKSISFHWEFMYTRSMFQTADQAMQHHILTQVARLADAGILSTTARAISARSTPPPCARRTVSRNRAPASARPHSPGSRSDGLFRMGGRPDDGPPPAPEQPQAFEARQLASGTSESDQRGQLGFTGALLPLRRRPPSSASSVS